MKRFIAGVMAMLLLAVACQTEKLESTEESGILDIAISGEPSFDVLVKSQTLSAEEAAGYNVSIFTDSDVLKYGPVEYSAFEAQVLPLGTYYVTAENLTTTEAEEGNGQMRLAGRSNDVVLTPSAISQTATVECKVTNAKVAVEFDSSVSGMFDNLKVVLTGGTTSGRTLTVAETAAGTVTETWFNPSNLSYTISGTFKPTGKPLTLSNSRTLAAKDNIKVLVKLNLENGEISGAPEIVVDVTMSQATPVEEEFNPYAK
jgi:hypothetical protein